MKVINLKDIKKKKLDWIIEQLNSGKVGILPTDTIYGIHVRALDEKAIEKIYNLKKRDQRKPMIILISSLDDLKIFNIKLNDKIYNFLNKIWPDKVSVILPINSGFSYLHRGTNKLAFRIPNNKLLSKILPKTGPLISTSANLAKHPPTINLDNAKNYFKNQIDFYVNSGDIKSKPSTIIEIDGDQIKVLREGSVKLNG